MVCNAVLGCWRQLYCGGTAGLWRQQLGVALRASCGAEWWWMSDQPMTGRGWAGWWAAAYEDLLLLVWATCCGCGLLSGLVGDGGVSYDYCNSLICCCCWRPRCCGSFGGSKSAWLQVAWRAGGFWWLLLGTPDLPSGEGGVFCGGSLLVEKMNSVDPDVGFFFCNQNSRFFEQWTFFF